MPPTNLNAITPPPQILADKESAKETPDNYEKLRAEQDGMHSIRFAALFFHIARCGIIVLFLILFCLLLIWIWHLITPHCWQWLDDKETAVIERILYSSAFISLAGRYFSKYNLFGKKKEGSD